MREATLQQIDTVSPIPGADFLELATLKGLGWTFVVMLDSLFLLW